MATNKNLIKCYILNLLNGDKIEFELLPEEVSESVGTNWDSTDIRGRTAPFIGYNNNSSRSVSITFPLREDYCREGVLETVNKMKALCYPKTGSYITPPRCFVRVGDMIAMRAVVESVGVSWSGVTLKGKANYSQADVSVEFIQYYSDDLPDVGSISSNGGNSF